MRVHRRFQEFARIELASVRRRDLAERRGHRQPAVGVDIDLADAVPDAAEISSTGTPQVCGISPPNWLKRSCSGCGTEEEPCITRCVWQPAVDFLDHAAWRGCRRPACARTCRRRATSHCDREGIDLGGANEVDRLIGIGEQLVMSDRRPHHVRPPLRPAMSPATRARRAPPPPTHRSMSHFDHATGDVDIVVVIGGVLASACNEPSIITDVKPFWIAVRQVASSLPWSWWRQIGIAGSSLPAHRPSWRA